MLKMKLVEWPIVSTWKDFVSTRVYILPATFNQCQVSHSRSYLECQYNWWSTNKEKGKVENMQFTSNVSQSDEKFMRAFPKQQEQRTRKFEEFYWKPPFLTMCIHNCHSYHHRLHHDHHSHLTPPSLVDIDGATVFPFFRLKIMPSGSSSSSLSSWSSYQYHF